MDTVITVTLYGTDKHFFNEKMKECEHLLSELESLWDRYSEQSEIAILNRNRVLENPDDRTVSLLATAEKVRRKTNSAFDIRIAPLMDLWKTCAEGNRLPTEEELQVAVEKTQNAELTVTNDEITLSGGSVDLGGIGKGMAAQAIMELLNSPDVSGGFVSFGSNIAFFGQKPDGSPFRTSIRDPNDTNKTVGTLTLMPEEILSVSGGYERFYTIDGENYHHILDPKTGFPAESGLASVAVICRDGALADALSTAFFVMGEDAAMLLYSADVLQFKAIFIYTSGEIHVTNGLKDRFFNNVS